MLKNLTREGTTSRFLILASVAVVVAGLYLAQEVLIPLALAVLLAFLLSPLCNLLERWKVPRTVAVVGSVLLAVAAVAGLGYVLWDGASGLAEDLPKYQENIVDKLKKMPHSAGVFDRVGGVAHDINESLATTQPGDGDASTQPAAFSLNVAAAVKDAVNRLYKNPLSVKLQEPERGAVGQLFHYLEYALGPLELAFIVTVFVIFMLLQRDDLRDRLIRLASGGQLGIATQALDDATTRISRYLLAQAAINSSYGVAVALGLLVIGYTVGGGVMFPSFLLWGLVCGVMRFVPYVGPWIGAAFPATVAFAAFPSFWVVIAVLGLFVALELITANVLEPWLYGSSTGMSPIAVLVAAVFWTWLWGPVGLIIATPVTACVVTLGKYVPQLQFLDILLGDEEVLSPPQRLYQRLLALDQEEATEVIDDFLEDRPLEALYDEVVMPALGLAELDRHEGRLDDDRQDFIRTTVRGIVQHLGAAYDPDAEAEKARRLADRRLKEAAKEHAKVNKAAKSNGKSGLKSGGNGTASVPGNKRRGSVDELPGERPGAARVDRSVAEAIDVLILPAHDEADELVGLMLSQLLAHRGYRPRALTQDKLASEMVAAVEDPAASITVLSALPPAAFVHARYLAKRLQLAHPGLRLVAGLWTSTGDMKKAKNRLESGGHVEAVTTLAAAMEEVRQNAYEIAPAKRAEEGERPTSNVQRPTSK